MDRWRHLAIFAGEWPCIVIWRGWRPEWRSYSLTRERARRLGRLLDGRATVKNVYGEPVYVWDDWDWAAITKGGR